MDEQRPHKDTTGKVLKEIQNSILSVQLLGFGIFKLAQTVKVRRSIAQWSKLRGHVWLFSKIGTSKYVENQYFKIPLIQMFNLN